MNHIWRRLTQREWWRDSVKVTISRIKNQKLPIMQNLNTIRLNSKLTSIKHSFHIVTTLKFHHWFAQNPFNKNTQKSTKKSINFKKKNKKWLINKACKDPNSIPVLVVALREQTHLEKAGTALERNPETSSEIKMKEMRKRWELWRNGSKIRNGLVSTYLQVKRLMVQLKLKLRMFQREDEEWELLAKFAYSF